MEKKYTTDKITVIWKPDLCIHSEKCVDHLPEVFKPNEKPWIDVSGAEAQKIKRAIDNCPSGALSYEKIEGGSSESLTDTKLKMINGGPVIVTGELSIEMVDGSVKKSKRISICRCGASGNRPFCDGSHKNLNFEG